MNRRKMTALINRVARYLDRKVDIEDTDKGLCINQSVIIEDCTLDVSTIAHVVKVPAYSVSTITVRWTGGHSWEEFDWDDEIEEVGRFRTPGGAVYDAFMQMAQLEVRAKIKRMPPNEYADSWPATERMLKDEDRIHRELEA